jgi:hypothetical protein
MSLINYLIKSIWESGGTAQCTFNLDTYMEVCGQTYDPDDLTLEKEAPFLTG